MVPVLFNWLKLRPLYHWLDLWLLYFKYVSLESISDLQFFKRSNISYELRFYLQEHVNHRLSLERLGHSLCFFAAFRTVKLLGEPVRKTPTTEDVQARRYLDGLVQHLVTNATLMLVCQLINKLLVPFYLRFSLLQSLCIHFKLLE